MSTSYIYSVSRVNTLSQELLTTTDIERLLVAAPGERLASALKETYLAPYVLQVDDERVADAIELTLIEAKNLISLITPNSSQFTVLWVQYDIHNLRVLAKATKAGHAVDALQGYFSNRGSYDPALLAQYAEQGTLSNLQPRFQEVYDQAVGLVQEGSIDEVDALFDALVLQSIKDIAAAAKDPFLNSYVAAVIDMHNCKSHLRSLRLGDKIVDPVFVSGGKLGQSSLGDVDSIVAALESLAVGHFTDAANAYVLDGHTTALDARFDEYLVKLAYNASIDMFSSASIVLYYLRVRQAATNIRTITVGLESGQSADVIRPNIRFSHVSN